MFTQYFKQALWHLRENPVISWISVLGTALSICMIMVIVITLRARIADCEPEVNRSRSLYVPNMSYRAKGDTNGSSANSRMSVQTGRECFKALTTAEAVTLVSQPGKVRASLPAGAKMTADKIETDEAFWKIFQFRFLDGKPFTGSDVQSGLPRVVIAASVARRLFGRTDVTGQHLELNHVDFQVCGVVADVSMLATDAYAQVWIPYTAGDAEANAWGYNLMGQMRAVILARSADDFPAIREECERLRQKYNDAQDGVEVFYRGQPDTQFTHLYRSWAQIPDVQGVVLRYIVVILVLLIVPAISTMISKISTELATIPENCTTLHTIEMCVGTENKSEDFEFLACVSDCTNLKNIIIDEEIKISTNFKKTIKGADLILIAVPAAFVDDVAKDLKKYLKPNQHIFIASKGIEIKLLLS